MKGAEGPAATSDIVNSPGPPAPGPGQSGALKNGLTEALIASCVGLFCAATAFAVYRVRPTELPLLWGAGGDMTPIIGILKGALQGYDITYNPNLGYPGFMDSAQFPLLADSFHWAQVITMGKLIGNPVTTVNAYVFLGFFEVGCFAYLLVRFLGTLRSLAMVLAAALCLIPWHFERAPSHIFLANYSSAIVGVGLVVAVWTGFFDEPNRRQRFLRLGLGMALAAVAATGGIYYAFMSSLLLIGVYALRLLVWRLRRPRWTSLVIVVAVPAIAGVTLVANELAQHSSTIESVTERFPVESTVYSGTIATLFLPDSRTWLGERLVEARPTLSELYGWSGGTAAFNMVVILCLVLALLSLVWGLFDIVKRPAWRAAQARNGYLQGLLLVVILMYATQAGGSLFAHLVTPEIRGWGRYSVYVAILSVCFAGVLLTDTAASPRSRRGRAVLAVIAGTFLMIETFTLAFGGYSKSERLDTELRPFVQELESALAEGCPVLQLPLMDYPEAGPINGLGGYSLMLPYVLSSDLRWSYGGMKGTREGTWGLDIRDDLPAIASRAQDVGFCGTLLDTSSLGDPGELQNYTAVFGSPDLVSSGGRWVYFDWDDATRTVPTLVPVSGFSAAEASLGDVYWWQTQARGRIEVSGLLPGVRSMTLELGKPPCRPALLEVNGQPVNVDVDRRWFTIPIAADDSGRVEVQIRAKQPVCTVDGDARQFYVRVFDGALTGSLGADAARAAEGG